MTGRLTPMRLERRGVLAGVGALGATSLLGPATAQPAGPLESTVVIRTTGGAFEQALKRNFFDPFTRATGVRVIPIAASYTEMWVKAATMQAAGRVEWDIVAPEFTELGNYARMLEDLGECSALPNVAAEGVPGTCGRYGILYLTGGQCLTWDPRAYPDRKPASWADFWDVEQFPGREMGYTTSNRAAASLLTPEEKKELVSSPEMVEGLVVLDAAWLEANRASSLERWNRWLAS